MLYKTIPIMERPNGSLQIDTNKVTLTQGDYNFNINYFTKEDYSDVSPIVNVQVSFRRKDGQQTGWLPLRHVRGNQYIINLKSTWFTTVPGNMYVTFRVFQTNSNNVNLIINTSSGTLVVNPTSAFNTPEPDIIPSEFEIYMSQTNEQLEDLRNDLSLSQLGKGIFDNEQELLVTYPNGVDYPDGTWAVLLSTNTVWLYNNETKIWYNSNRDVTDIFDLDDKVYRFAKQLYEESANLFTNEVSDPQKWDVWFGYTSQLKPNTTYAMKVFNRQNIGNGTLALYDNDTEIVDLVPNYQFGDSGVFTTPSNVVYGKKYRFRLKGTNGDDNRVFSNIMVVEGSIIPNQFYQYNANRHISNEQAEFLKDEHKNSINLCYEKTFTYNYGDNHYAVKLGAYPAGTYSIKTFNGGETYLYCNGRPIVSNAHNGGTFILTEQVNYLSLDSYGITSKSGFNVVIVKGNIIPVENLKFNANMHITNLQAELLKDECDKSLNMLCYHYKGTFQGVQYRGVNGKLTLNGTSSLAYSIPRGILNVKFEVGKTYKIVLFNNTLSENGINSIYLSYGGQGLLSSPLSPTNNVSYFTFGIDNAVSSEFGFDIYYTSAGVTFNNYQLELMIVEENVDVYEFSEWNGEIIHKKDIVPIKLWENPTPGNGFDPKLIYLPENFIIRQKYRLSYSFGVNWPIQYYDFEFVDGDNTNIIDFFRAVSADNHFNMATRQFVCYNNILDFGNCFYRDGSLNADILNSVMIPRALYKIKEV